MKTSIGFLLAGIAIGAGVSLLMSDSQKRQVRKKVYRGAEDLVDNLKDKVKASSNMIHDYAERAEERIDLLNKKIRSMERA